LLHRSTAPRGGRGASLASAAFRPDFHLVSAVFRWFQFGGPKNLEKMFEHFSASLSKFRWPVLLAFQWRSR